MFEAFSSDSDVQTTNAVEFPATLTEDQNGSESVSDDSGQTSQNPSAETDDATLKSQTDQWRALYQSKLAEVTQELAGLAGIPASHFRVPGRTVQFYTLRPVCRGRPFGKKR
ncbi:MAG: hypothetical protein ACLQU2_23075 [Candidatus Binataceae bacterium]